MLDSDYGLLLIRGIIFVVGVEFLPGFVISLFVLSRIRKKVSFLRPLIVRLGIAFLIGVIYFFIFDTVFSVLSGQAHF